MEGMGSEGEIGAGYMLVPWSSWDQWNFVREALFSSSHDSVAAALRRITAWKSRGCLPVAIEVTARIVEIQQMDPFFRKEVASNTINSEDMLAMLYSIALTRLVNGFVGKVSCFDDHAHKHGKKKHSISNLAEAIDMPRMVVDIRHESSHRDLPSLPSVRLASVKALDWLKSHYWEPQKKAIPDVRKEIRSRLQEMICYMRTKQQGRPKHLQPKERRVRQSAVLRMCNRLSSQMSEKLLHSKNNGSSKQLSKISKIIARLYSTYPYEVVSVLLEMLQSQALDLPSNIAVDCNHNSASSNPESHANCTSELRDIIHRLSKERPGLLLTMIKEVLGIIEAGAGAKYEKDEYRLLFPEHQTEFHQIKLLSSLVPWLLLNLKELRDSDQITLFEETQGFSPNKKFTPKISLKELLRKCLLLSSSGNKHLIDSAIFVAEMLGNNLVVKRVKELSLLSSQNIDIGVENSTFPSPEALISQEEESIKQAIAKFDLLKSRRQTVSTEATDVNPQMKKMWTVAKRWTSCPIGTLPCTFSSTAFLPVLDKAVGECVNNHTIVNENENQNISALGKRDASHDIGPLDDSPPLKKLKETAENGNLDDGNSCGVENGNLAVGNSCGVASIDGLLLVDGVWREVGPEELLAIESDVRILV